MLRIYDVILEVVREMRPHVEAIERRDADLARQMRRALTSVPLNVAEGSQSRGKNRGVRYQTAIGSMTETLACLQTADALGYIKPVDTTLLSKTSRVIATLLKNVR